ncbi:MAG: SLBB domain-containing protein [Verrucomicrobiota bacterium]
MPRSQRTSILPLGVLLFLSLGLQAQPVAPPVKLSAQTMAELDQQIPLNVGERVVYRVIEDQDPPSQLQILDSGELDVPYLGRRPAAGKTCYDLAQYIKSELEKELYHQATVLISRDRNMVGAGKIYVMGKVASQGPIPIPPGEVYTVSKAILAAGGFHPFADEGKVRLIRRTGESGEDVKEIIVNVKAVLEKGELDKDVEVRPEDRIIVKAKFFNI